MKINGIFTTVSLCAASVLASVTAQAAVTLLVDDHIKVTAVNGQEMKNGLFQSPTKQLTLEPGRHVITAKYDRLYNLPRDEHDYLRSGNISVTADLQDNQTYHLSMLGQPEDYEQAKEYAQHPTLAIQQNNQVIAKQDSINSQRGGLLSGVTQAIGGIFGGNDAQNANQQAIAALEQSNNGGANANTQPASATANPNNTSTLDQFMQLWLQATPAEREKIRQWIEQ